MMGTATLVDEDPLRQFRKAGTFAPRYRRLQAIQKNVSALRYGELVPKKPHRTSNVTALGFL